MAGTGDVNAVIVADGFTDAATLPSFGGSATGGVTALPTNWPHIPVAPPIVEPTAGGDAEPAGPPAATVDPPAGAGDGGAVAEPAAPPNIPVQPPAGGGAGGAIPQPGALNPVAIVAPIGGAGGGGVPIPVFWDPIIIYPILGPAIGGGGAFPVFGPIIPIQPPIGGGDGTAIITPSLPAPLPVSPPTGGAIGTDPTAVGLPLPTIPAAPPTGTGGGGATTSPVAPTGPGTTAPDGGAGGGGGATPTGPTQVPITAPTGTGTGTGTTSPTLPSVPVTAPTGGAVGGDASTGVGEPIPTTTVSAPAATVTTDVAVPSATVIPTVNPAPMEGGATGVSGGTTTQTLPCGCCFSCKCGPYPTDGPYWFRWFGTNLVGEANGDCPGAGDTSVPENLTVKFTFNIPGTFGYQYVLEFENYGTTGPWPSGVVGRYAISGTVPSTPAGGPSVTLSGSYLYLVLYKEYWQNYRSALILSDLTNSWTPGAFNSYETTWTISGTAYKLTTAYPPLSAFSAPRIRTRVIGSQCCPFYHVMGGSDGSTSDRFGYNVSTSSGGYYSASWEVRRVENCTYWCVGGLCVRSTTQPAGATGGPWTSPYECSANCAPAQMGNPTTTAAQDLIQQSKTRLALPCIHRGRPLEESASCGCGGAVLTACSLYGQCRPYGTATDAQVCTRCPDYAAP